MARRSLATAVRPQVPLIEMIVDEQDGRPEAALDEAVEVGNPLKRRTSQPQLSSNDCMASST